MHEDMQDTQLTKLVGTFIEQYDAQCFERFGKNRAETESIILDSLKSHEIATAGVESVEIF